MDDRKLADALTKLPDLGSALQTVQTLYDEVGWDISNPDFDKLRHVQIHLSITVGKIAQIIEPIDHKNHNRKDYDLTENVVLIGKALADLIYHSTQIAEIFDLNIGTLIDERLKENSVRFCPDSDFARIINSR